MLRYNPDQYYICFDFETCNLNLVDTDNKPWQLSYLLSKGQEIYHRSDNYILWPDLKMSREAAEVTHFNREKYERLAKDPGPILSEFEKYLYDDKFLIVGQNLLGFDVYVYNIYRRCLGLKVDYSFLERIIDTNCVAKAIKKQFRPLPGESMLSWQYKLADFREKGLKTSVLAQLKEYKIPFDEHRLHDSMYDVEMNFKIFLQQAWTIEI